jgi:tripeptidyl-peptidase-1
MKLSAVAILGSFAAFVFAAPAPNSYIVYEKRSVQNEKWSLRRDIKLNRDAVIPMSFGLAQRNLENGYDFLMDVSHPGSKNYGKHWPVSKVSGRYLFEKQLKLTELDRRYFCSLN